MEKLNVFFAAAAAAALCRAELPEVGDVTMRQASNSRLVTVQYRITNNVPGIITLSVETNGVSIGDENVTFVEGDVNCLVTNTSSPRTILWRPDKSWPGHKFTEAVVSARVKAWATDAPPDYLVADLVDGSVAYYTCAGALPKGGLTNDLYKTDKLVLRKIPAALDPWRMGTEPQEGETGADYTRETNQVVTLPEDYYIGVFQVTQRQWWRVMKDKPSYFGAFYDQYPGRPVEQVSYYRIRESSGDSGNTANEYPAEPNGGSFLGKLREKTGNLVAFDLPSDAQWECACRAGTTQKHWNDGSDIKSDWGVDTNLWFLGRYNKNGGQYGDSKVSPTGGTAVVGSYLPNAWGLYDMHGNVWEWCLDWYDPQHVYPAGDGAVNTNVSTVAGVGSVRVRRGGGWSGNAQYARSAYRISSAPGARGNSFGFRVAAPAAAGQR